MGDIRTLINDAKNLAIIYLFLRQGSQNWMILTDLWSTEYQRNKKTQ